MKKRFLLPALFLVCSVGMSQRIATGSMPRPVPIFQDKEDSIAYNNLDKEIQATWSNASYKPDKKKDSLRGQKFNELLSKASGHRNVYKPRFTLLDSLTKEERKFIGRVSIINLKAKKLPPELFECENLERLELVNTSIDTIQQAIENLKELKILEIYNNRINHPLFIEKNSSITHLIIRSENNGSVPKRFNSLKALETLDLCGNHLTRFPDIRKNNKLSLLLLTDNAIKKIKGKRLPSLTKLDVRYNSIKVVSGSVGKFKNLQTLFLNFNTITKVRHGVGRLKKLEYLSLYQNELMHVPSAFYKLTALINIDLYYNYIETVSDKIKNWNKLSVLHLANNRIYSLPNALGNLKNLKELYVFNNRLTTLPESLDNLIALKVLRANDNYLTPFPNQILSFTQLEQLDIANNRIASIPQGIFAFDHFQIVSLKGNPWDDASREIIAKQTETLRRQKVVVLVDD